ncbi:VOC family protein [Streptomyces sp. NPDC051109]|uniref:VOC family protein n=1 Tax=Streptomyces sp. NPDC051109 TaxID=3365642 RepID=UPI0037BA0913
MSSNPAEDVLDLGVSGCRGHDRQHVDAQGPAMISGAHVILYSQDAEADRAFIRDVLGFPGIDAGGGWLIFKLPPSEVAVHPADGPPRHEFYLMCDDLDSQLDEFRAKGVEITRPVSEQRWGKMTAVRLPSGAELPLYEPLHPIAHSL